MEQQHYLFRVYILRDQHTTLVHGDIFKFRINVSSYSTDINPITNLLYYSHSLPCHHFFHEDQDFLRTQLNILFPQLNSFLESVEEIVDNLICVLKERFQFVDDASSSPLESQHREVPLELEIILYDDMLAAMEESMLTLKLVPADNEAIQRLLRKPTIMKWNECFCAICLEDLDVNIGECYSMPCLHVFHHQCIVTWLQTSHVCPLCRYALPTIEN